MIGLRWLAASPKRVLLCIILLTGLFGCSGGGVGKGNAPAYLVIYQSGSFTPATTVYAFECFREAVTARMFFTDGTSGDFTSRVVWSSSSPGTISISNGDQPAPTGGFYKNGTMTPASAGNAVITADYDGIASSINVIVDTPQAVTVERIVQGNPVVPTGNAFRMGVATTESLTAVATLNGVQQNIAGQQGVSWSFMPPDDDEATIDPTTGIITGISAGTPLSATISFDSCQIQASTTVTVENIQAISLQAEFGSASLIVGNTEKMNVFADFGSGPEQDISTEATLTSSDPTIFLFGTSTGSNIGAGTAAGDINVNAQFLQGGSTVPAANLTLSVIIATLENISVTPETATLDAGSLTTAQFRAYGSYNEGTITQEVTRQTNWSVSDSTVASISNIKQTAGEATAASSTKGGAINVIANDPLATITPMVMVDLTVLAP